MAPTTLLVAACLAGLVGVGVLRAAWSRPKRSVPLNLAGWLIMLGGAALGWAAAGAWGTAVASLFPMGGAFVFLAAAAVASTPGKLKASNRRAGLLPEGAEPMRIAGRLLTFVLIGVLAAVLGVGLAVALGALLLLAGLSEADAYALALQLMPVFWAALAFALLMQPSRRGQFKVLGFSSLPVWPLLAAGVLS
jgi:hypothetical protein